MDRETVPSTTNLADIYSDPLTPSEVSSEHKGRISTLVKSFTSKYGSKPDFVARSPGRVNIIGEHIDYSLYNVLPMAVLVDTLVAVKIGQSLSGQVATLNISNSDPSRYGSREFTVPPSGEVEIDATQHDWTNYFKAGLQGAVSVMQEHKEPFTIPSMSIMVDGNVPIGNGLSSSAALVCSSALATLRACNHIPTKSSLLETAIVSERAVGVYSGGMDQAASIFSRKGYLLYCSFYPSFSAEHVPMPPSQPETTFLVAQSFVTSDKKVTAPRCYNLRVVECTLAAVVLAKLHDIVLDPDHSSLSFSLRSFQHEWCKKNAKAGDPQTDQLDHMLSLVDKSLPNDDGYTREAISSILGISVDTLTQTYLSKFPVEASVFHLRRRAQHVFNEARRVLTFRDVLSSASSLSSSQVAQLGALMNQTQDSCRDVYDCSCAEIDDLCAIARTAGAYGSRLTGAGWGGCTVHLVPAEKVDGVAEALKREYYAKRFPGWEKDEGRMREAIVVSKPGQGSFIVEAGGLG